MNNKYVPKEGSKIESAMQLMQDGPQSLAVLAKHFSCTTAVVSAYLKTAQVARAVNRVIYKGGYFYALASLPLPEGYVIVPLAGRPAPNPAPKPNPPATTPQTPASPATSSADVAKAIVAMRQSSEPKQAEQAPLPVAQTQPVVDAVEPLEQPAPASPPGFNCAIWDDGEMSFVRDGVVLLTITADETAQVRAYLGLPVIASVEHPALVGLRDSRPLVNTEDMLMAAMRALDDHAGDQGKKKFITTLHARLLAREAAAKSEASDPIHIDLPQGDNK